MTRADVVCVLQANALNGESPAWSDAEAALYWVDIKAPALHAFEPSTGRDRSWPMPSEIGCFALSEGGAIVALRSGLYAFDIGTADLRRLAAPPYDPSRFRFNDGRCDRQGRFLAGPMYSPLGAPHPGPETSPLWRFDGDAGWRSVGPPVKISNGLAWSPDGRVMYHCDTPSKTIWRHDYDEASGTVSDRRVFAHVDEGGDDGGPDGASVDRDGFYICAVFGAGCLLRFDPQGRLERRILMPARYVTMPNFGGADLSTLYVTSAAFPLDVGERAKRPLEGGLFALEAPVPGLPSSRFRQP